MPSFLSPPLIVMLLLTGVASAQETSWIPMSAEDAPSAREAAVVVDAGGLLVVWGGAVHLGEGRWRFHDDGAVYDPAADRWTTMASEAAPAARAWHSAVWTGSEVVVWGGQAETEFADGAAFDPRKNTWRTVSSKGAPRGRVEHAAAWDGKRMIVWSGVTEERSFLDGAAYDPVTDRWSSIPAPEMPFGRRALKAVVAGGRFLVWGGINGGSSLGDGAALDLESDTWTPIAEKGAPASRAYPGAAALGKRLLIWGGNRGIGGDVARGDGAIYDPTEKRWTPIVAAGAPTPRVDHLLLPFAEGFLVWGGRQKDERRRDGAIHDLEEGSWREIPPAPRAAPFQAALRRGDDLILLTWDRERSWAGRLELKAGTKR